MLICFNNFRTNNLLKRSMVDIIEEINDCFQSLKLFVRSLLNLESGSRILIDLIKM